MKKYQIYCHQLVYESRYVAEFEEIDQAIEECSLLNADERRSASPVGKYFTVELISKEINQQTADQKCEKNIENVIHSSHSTEVQQRMEDLWATLDLLITARTAQEVADRDLAQSINQSMTETEIIYIYVSENGSWSKSEEDFYPDCIKVEYVVPLFNKPKGNSLCFASHQMVQAYENRKKECEDISSRNFSAAIHSLHTQARLDKLREEQTEYKNLYIRLPAQLRADYEAGIEHKSAVNDAICELIILDAGYDPALRPGHRVKQSFPTDSPTYQAYLNIKENAPQGAECSLVEEHECTSVWCQILLHRAGLFAEAYAPIPAGRGEG